MARADRPVSMAVSALFSRFSFFQQIREMLKKCSRAATKEERTAWLEEHVLLQSDLTLDATKGVFSRAEFAEDSGKWLLSVCEGGLTGASGALPLVYTEWFMEQAYRWHDHAGMAFLNIFNHRLYCLRYLAWAHRHAYAYGELTSERLAGGILQALSGNGGTPECGPDGGRYFMPATRSVSCLVPWLGRILGTDIHISPFQVRWRKLREDERCRLGPGLTRLGDALAVGRYLQERQTSFTLTLGPLPVGEAALFYPGQQNFKKLQDCLSLFLGRGNGLFFYLVLLQYMDPPGALMSPGALGQTLILGPGNPGVRMTQRLSFPVVYRADTGCVKHE